MMLVMSLFLSGLQRLWHGDDLTVAEGCNGFVTRGADCIASSPDSCKDAGVFVDVNIVSFAGEEEAMFVGKIHRLLALAAGALLLAVVALAAPAPKMPAPEPLTDAEKAGVQSLHRTTVEVFIDRPGFGIRRMPLRVDDLITAPKPAPMKDGDDKDKQLKSAPAQNQPAVKAKEAHFAVQDLIGDDGMFRLVTEDKKEVWKVRKLQLVGLVKHTEPVVYLADKMPDMKEAKDVPTRELDAFEKDALKTLKGGENLKTEKHGKEIRVLGPIYAGARCVACHETKGQMLGAFTYELERVPYDPEKDKPAPRVPRK